MKLCTCVQSELSYDSLSVAAYHSTASLPTTKPAFPDHAAVLLLQQVFEAATTAVEVPSGILGFIIVTYRSL